MPRYTEPDDDEDDEYPEGVYHDDELPTVACRHCHEEILEDSEQCPHCGIYQSDEDSPGEPKSRTWIVLMVLALIAVAIMTFGL